MLTRYTRTSFILTFFTTALLLLGITYLSVSTSAWAAPAQQQKIASAQDTSVSAWTPPQPAYRVIIDQTKPEAIYQLDYNTLANAGLPVDTLDPHTLRMFWMGEEIAIQVIGEADNHFDANDSILFYGRNLDELFYDGLFATNKYSGDNIFWLSYGATAGQRMASVDGTPAAPLATAFLHKQHLEQNHYYLPTASNTEGEDHWFWQKFTAFGTGSKSKDYTFTANNISTEALTGTLSVKIYSSVRNKTHELTLLVNGNEVYHNKGDWVGDTIFVATAEVPQSYFQEGSNTVTVKITNDINSGVVDEVFTNWIDVSYYDTYVAENNHLVTVSDTGTSQQLQISNFSADDIAVFDISDLRNVKTIDNGVVTEAGPYTINFDTQAERVLATTPDAWQTPTSIEAVSYPSSPYTPDDLLETSLAADYILITHADFWDQSLQLAEHRAKEYDVVMVDAQQIYDQFNGGVMSAESIRDFLSYTYYHWAKRPRYVLLVGDGTYDMRNYLGSSFETYIPVFLHLVGSITGETAAENQFVTLESDSTYGDLLPDMHLGRFPVNTADEAQAMVDKTINYETATCSPPQLDVIFAADDEDGNLYWELSDGVADGYADAPTNTIKYLPAPYTSTKKYLGDTCNHADDGNAASGEECRQELIDKLNDTGALLMSYVGHSTKNMWAVEQIWNESAVDELTNDNACELPVMLAMGCDEGYFHDPGDTAVSEYGVRKLDVGPVASISPTYYGFPRAHDTLEKGIFLAIFQDKLKELGPILTQGKQNALDNGNTTEADGFMLMGDPALKLRTTSVELGDYVWWDVDGDGVQDAEEPPLANLTVTLKDTSGNTLTTTTTDADGRYHFTGLPAGDYKVSFSKPGNDWILSPQAQTSADKDSDADVNTGETDALSLDAGVVNYDIDAGMTITSSYTLTKINTTRNAEILSGDPLSFTIAITNTGATWINTLPLRDTYDKEYLTYLSASTPADDSLDDGILDWSDLTASFGQELGPGEHFSIIVNFIAKKQTQNLPNGQTTNTATAHDVQVDPDGANGPLTVTGVLAEQAAAEPVSILNPVGETMSDFSLLVAGHTVRVRWQTASETNIFGFNILRRTNNQPFAPINESPILAHYAGADVGAAYQFIDASVQDGAYEYQLEILRLDGSVEHYGLLSLNQTSSQF